MEHLTGIHAVREAISSGRALERILVARGRRGDRIEELVRLARQHGVPVRFEERSQLDRIAGRDEHQGVVALAAAKRVSTLRDIIADAGPDALLVVLDGIEDPRNLGAIVRSALAAGAAGVVVAERRAAGLTDTASRASAGALEHLSVARVVNLSRSMEELKEAGWWLVGLDERAEKSHTDQDLTGKIALILGGEGKGLHELVRKRCDFLVSIPTVGPVRSLNVSVAAGIVLFESVRQRKTKH
ncbi:MAG TPA: 23S rRNA (guanosine(2251)-2'-O)-methyltransferase RlmB [Candidatus Acidoferrales bacterium]|nr:23S rRNA (guanosine(2251)-2'-O)-methyltransferase RlmB [Candidatus Acidoferrales bacterium]